jgi:hypothetical protein
MDCPPGYRIETNGYTWRYTNLDPIYMDMPDSKRFTSRRKCLLGAWFSHDVLYAYNKERHENADGPWIDDTTRRNNT